MPTPELAYQVPIVHTQLDVHVQTHMHACTHMHVHTHTRTHARTHAHTHAHTLQTESWDISLLVSFLQDNFQVNK